MTVVKRADGSVIKTKGGTELRSLVHGSASYELESLKGNESENPPAQAVDVVFCPMEEIEALSFIVTSDDEEPEPQPEPEQKPQVEPEQYTQRAQEVLSSHDPKEIASFSLDLILRAVDSEIDALIRAANLLSAAPKFVTSKPRPPRTERPRFVDNSRVLVPARLTPLLGRKIQRRVIDPFERPVGRPALGVCHALHQSPRATVIGAFSDIGSQRLRLSAPAVRVGLTYNQAQGESAVQHVVRPNTTRRRSLLPWADRSSSFSSARTMRSSSSLTFTVAVERLGTSPRPVGGPIQNPYSLSAADGLRQRLTSKTFIWHPKNNIVKSDSGATSNRNNIFPAKTTDAINNSLHSRMNRDSAFGYSGWGQRQRRSEWVLQMTQATIASPRQMAYPSRTANANI